MKFTTCLVAASVLGNVSSLKIQEKCRIDDEECCSKYGQSCNFTLRVKEFKFMLEDVENSPYEYPDFVKGALRFCTMEYRPYLCEEMFKPAYTDYYLHFNEDKLLHELIRD